MLGDVYAIAEQADGRILVGGNLYYQNGRARSQITRCHPDGSPDSSFQVTTNGTVNFAAGETSKSITLNINADTTIEPDESFSVVLSNPVNATLGTSSATQTIVTDDVDVNGASS